MEVNIPTDEKIARKVESLTRILLFPLFLPFQADVKSDDNSWKKNVKNITVSFIISLYQYECPANA